MTAYDDYNPSNKRGPVQTGAVAIGVVVSDRDPNQTGRVRARILGDQHDQGQIPDDQLQWLQSVTPQQPQLRGVGTFPPSKYLPGSKIAMLNVGQQGYVVLGAIGNNEKDDGIKDTHSEAMDTSPLQVVSAIGNVFRKMFAGQGHSDYPRNTQIAFQFLNGQFQSLTSVFKGNPVEKIINEAKVASQYGERLATKVKKGQFKSAGTVKFDGELQNLQKFMINNKLPEMIPNVIAMIEQAKQTAIQGLNIPAVQALGGIQNILGGLAGIASAISTEKAGYNQQNQQLLEEELRRIYMSLTNKEPIDQFGNETLDYKKWKQYYIETGVFLYADITNAIS